MSGRQPAEMERNAGYIAGLVLWSAVETRIVNRLSRGAEVGVMIGMELTIGRESESEKVKNLPCAEAVKKVMLVSEYLGK